MEFIKSQLCLCSSHLTYSSERIKLWCSESVSRREGKERGMLECSPVFTMRMFLTDSKSQFFCTQNQQTEVQGGKRRHPFLQP